MNQYNPAQAAVKMVEESLRRNARRPQELDRQAARLAVIIQGCLKDGCYVHEVCQTQAECMAKEIIERRLAWE